MDTILILCTSIGSAYIASKLNRHAPFLASDLLLGMIGGIVSLVLANYLVIEGVNPRSFRPGIYALPIA